MKKTRFINTIDWGCLTVSAAPASAGSGLQKGGACHVY